MSFQDVAEVVFAVLVGPLLVHALYRICGWRKPWEQDDEP